MPEQREYIVEESRGLSVHGHPLERLERINELRREGWGGAVIQPMQRLDGSVFLVLIMSRPAKLEFEVRVMGEKVTVDENGYAHVPCKCPRCAAEARWAARPREGA